MKLRNGFVHANEKHRNVAFGSAGQLRRAPKSRDYRKLHLCVDGQTGEVVAGAVFVSVTESFNTATSMGRLTLHMLLVRSKYSCGFPMVET